MKSFQTVYKRKAELTTTSATTQLAITYLVELLKKTSL